MSDIITITFFRKHVESGEVLIDYPYVWTFRADQYEAAKSAVRELRTKSHLFVPEVAITVPIDKSNDC